MTSTWDFAQDTNGWVVIIIWALWTPFFLSTFLMSIFRRNRYPIKQREPLLLCTSAVAGYLMMTEYCWQQFASPDNFPCVLSLWMIWLVFPCYFMPYPLRAFRLIVIFKISGERADIGLLQNLAGNSSDGTPQPKEKSILFRYQDLLLRCGYLMPLVSVIMFIIGMVRQFTIPENLPPNTDCQNSEQFFINCLIIFVFFLGGLLILIFFLRNIQDEFNISNELKIVSLAWTLLLVPFLVTNLVYTSQGSEPPATVYLLMAWTMISYMVTNCWPLYRSFRETPQVEWPGVDILRSFDNLLQSGVGIPYFQQFLVVDFSVENLLFYLDVQSFSKIEDNKKLVRRALQIYDKYIQPHAPFWINIDQNIAGPIDAKIAGLRSQLGIQEPNFSFTGSLRRTHLIESAESPVEINSTVSDDQASEVKELFKEAQIHCYEQMKQATWPRFLRSAPCKKLAEKLAKSEMRKSKLEALKMI